MKKFVKLGLYVLLMALLGLMMWLSHGKPRFSAEGAYHRVEQRQLMEQSTVVRVRPLDYDQRFGNSYRIGTWKPHIVAGVSDTHLRMTLVYNRMSRWFSDKEMVSFPLEDYTFGIFPWEEGDFAHGGFLYTRLPYARGEGMLTVGSARFSTAFTPHESGLTNFSFAGLSESGEARKQMEYLAYDLLLQYGYDETKKTADVRLELTLFDENDQEITKIRKDYPKYHGY